MQLTLIRSGGIIPITKTADIDVDWADHEVGELVNAIKHNSDNAGNQRDATGYELKYDGGTIPVNLEKVPPKFQKTIDELKDKLTIVKP